MQGTDGGLAAAPQPSSSSSVAQDPFGDLLSARVSARESQLVLGVDPDPGALWPVAGELRDVDVAALSVGELTAARVLVHCRALIDAAAPACVAVKLQLACFERLQAPGWAALGKVAEHARGHGLLVLADGKRGDIPVSAAAYAQALFGGVRAPDGEVPGLSADAATVSPLLGSEALSPFIEAARPRRAGVFVLVRTSNPGARDVQDLSLADGGTVWERLATMVAQLGTRSVGRSGLSDVGAVMGATEPAHLERARKLMPHTVFLLPGIGTQGGDARALSGALAAGAASEPRASALITASRSIAGAYVASGGPPAEAARGEAERLRAQAWSLV